MLLQANRGVEKKDSQRTSNSHEFSPIRGVYFFLPFVAALKSFKADLLLHMMSLHSLLDFTQPLTLLLCLLRSTKPLQHSSVISAAQTQKDSKRAQISQQEQAKISTNFYAFLEASAGFYSGLLSKMRAKYGFSMDYASLSAVNEEGDASQGLTLPSRTNLTAFRILIRLGDLARYQRDALGVNDADWSASWTYYLDAQKVMPEQGMPYNQLAVLCTYAHDTIGALFYYSQSLSLPVPSETGKSNIEVLMRDASLANYVAAKRKYSETARIPKKARTLGEGLEAGSAPAPVQANSLGELWTVFAQGFLAIHNSSDAKSLEEAVRERDNILADFEMLVGQDWIVNNPPSAVPGPSSPFSSTFLQLMLYNIFACWYVTSQSQKAAPAAREVASDRARILYHFALSMLSIIIERAVSDLNASQNDAASSVGGTVLLPAIATFLEWTVLTAPHLVFDANDSADQILYDKLKYSIKSLLDVTLPIIDAAATSSKWQSLSVFAPLPEDLLLHPCLPLAESHESVDFTLKCYSGHNALVRRCLKIYNFASLVNHNPLLLSSTNTGATDSQAQYSANTHSTLLTAQHSEDLHAIAVALAGGNHVGSAHDEEVPASPGFHSQSSSHRSMPQSHQSPQRQQHPMGGSLSSVGSSESPLGLLVEQADLYGTSSSSMQGVAAPSAPHSLFPRAVAAPPSPQAISRPRTLFSDSAVEDDPPSHSIPEAQPSSHPQEEYDPWGQHSGHAAAMAVDPSPQDSVPSLPDASIMASGNGHFNPFLFPNPAPEPHQPSQLGMMAQGTQSMTRNALTPFAFPSSNPNASDNSHPNS